MDSRTPPQMTYHQLQGGRLHLKNPWECVLRDKNGKEFRYTNLQSLGKGSYGETSKLTCTFAPPIVLKKFFPRLIYSEKATPEHIENTIQSYRLAASHEATYNKLIGGLGMYFELNSNSPIQVEKKPDEKGNILQYVVSPPYYACIAIKFEEGVLAKAYAIPSVVHYLNFSKAALRSLQEKFHQRNLVHSDIHEKNVLVKANRWGNVAVNYIDMTFCDYKGKALSTTCLNLDIKPPEFKQYALIHRKENQDIFCLGDMLRSLLKKCNIDHFPTGFQANINKIIDSMTAVIPDERPQCHQLWNQFKKIRGELANIYLTNPHLLIKCNAANDAEIFFQQLRIIANQNDRYNLLEFVYKLNPGYFAGLSHLEIKKFLSLWKNNDVLKREVLADLFLSQWHNINASTASDIVKFDQLYYCHQIIHRLEINEANIIALALTSYKKLKTSSLTSGEGVTCFLRFVPTVSSFADNMQAFSEEGQLHLLHFGHSQELRRLVDETNVLEVLEAMKCPGRLLEKLGDQHLQTLSENQPPDRRAKLLRCIIENRIASTNFKTALRSFDTWNHQKELHRQIVFAFNAIFYKTTSENKNAESRFKLFGYSRAKKLEASAALVSGDAEKNWEKYKGPLSHGRLGEVGRRIRRR